MPLYDFHCPDCGRVSTFRLSMETRDDPRLCPQHLPVDPDRHTLRRLPTAPAVLVPAAHRAAG